MRRAGMKGENPQQNDMAEDLDDIATLMNLLELHSRLKIETSHFENELDGPQVPSPSSFAHAPFYRTQRN